MTVENKLKALIISRYDNVATFTKQIGIPNSTFASIMSRGIINANMSSMIKICNALHISLDALVGGQIISTSEVELPENADLKDRVDALRTDLIVRSDLMFGGRPLTPLLASDLEGLLGLTTEYIQKRQ